MSLYVGLNIPIHYFNQLCTEIDPYVQCIMD